MSLQAVCYGLSLYDSLKKMFPKKAASKNKEYLMLQAFQKEFENDSVLKLSVQSEQS